MTRSSLFLSLSLSFLKLNEKVNFFLDESEKVNLNGLRLSFKESC
jgi:hypothetical protein